VAIKKQKTIIVPKENIIKVYKPEVSSHAPKIGDGLGIAVVRISKNKRNSTMSSSFLNTRPDVEHDEKDEEHVFPPYQAQA
jgi:hypothetical protein